MGVVSNNWFDRVLIHTPAPAPTSYTHFIIYPFVLRKCSANSLGHGHGHGYACHSPRPLSPLLLSYYHHYYYYYYY